MNCQLKNDVEVEKVGLYCIRKGYRHHAESEAKFLSDALTEVEEPVALLKAHIAAWDNGERDELPLPKT